MIYTAKLKTRSQMQRDIPAKDLGWWHDVCPGKTLELRDATAADVARCSMREGTSRDPADYLCETFERGSLVHRKAVDKLTPIDEAELERRVRHAIHTLGPERVSRVLAKVGDCVECDVRQPAPRTIRMILETPEAAAHANALLLDPKSGWRLAPAAPEAVDLFGDGVLRPTPAAVKARLQSAPPAGGDAYHPLYSMSQIESALGSKEPNV